MNKAQNMDIVAIIQRLGSPDPIVQAHVARVLHEAEETGLTVVLTLWYEEMRQAKWRSRIEFLAIILAVVLASLFIWSPDFVRQLIGFGILFAGILGMTALSIQTQRRKNLAKILVRYDDRRLLQPLAQILETSIGASSNAEPEADVQTRQKASDRIRQLLQQEPNHQIIFPDIRWILRWEPERPRRPVRWVHLWLSQAILSWAIFTLIYTFLGIHNQIPLMITIPSIMPLVTIKTQGARLQSDIVYFAKSASPAWKGALNASACVGMVGICIHLLTGHLEWWEIALLAGLAFFGFWLREKLAPTLLGPVPAEPLIPGNGPVLDHPQG